MMTKEVSEALKYPTGRFEMPQDPSTADLNQWQSEIKAFPSKIATITAPLSAVEMGWRYRPEGWSIRQVVNHCADSHMNAYVRFRWALTEDHPRIKAYFQAAWAELPDTKEAPIAPSILMLRGVHTRWSFLMSSMSADQWRRTYEHPEGDVVWRLDQVVALYAWHCNHHLAHIRQALDSNGAY